MNRWQVFAVAIVILVVSMRWPVTAQEKEKYFGTKWEYKTLLSATIIQHRDETIAREGQAPFEVGLNTLGRDGWELVTVEKSEYYFKRHIR